MANEKNPAELAKRTEDLLTDATFGLSALETLVDDLEARLTAIRAGYLDNLSGGAVALQSSVDDLEGRLTAVRAGYLDNLSAGAVALQSSVDDLEGRLTATRAGYLDNLSAGAVALQSSVDDLEGRLTAARAGFLDELDPATAGKMAAEVDIIKEAVVLRRNTAQAGAATTITLDASASATDDLYNGALVVIASGTGAGQHRYVSDYVGSTKVATVDTSWAVNPDSSSVFVLFPGIGRPPSTITSGTFSVANNTNDQDVTSFTGTPTTPVRIVGYLDFNAAAQNKNIWLQVQVDGANYRKLHPTYVWDGTAAGAGKAFVFDQIIFRTWKLTLANVTGEAISVPWAFVTIPVT